MSTASVTLTFAGFREHVCRSAHMALVKEEYADLLVGCLDRQRPRCAHRAVLARCAPVLVTESLSHDEVTSVLDDGVSGDHVDILLDFLYTGEALLDGEEGLLALAALLRRVGFPFLETSCFYEELSLASNPTPASDGQHEM